MSSEIQLVLDVEAIALEDLERTGLIDYYADHAVISRRWKRSPGGPSGSICVVHRLNETYGVPAFPNTSGLVPEGMSTRDKARDHRERQIAEVLIRYGLSYLGNIVGLGYSMTAAHRRVALNPR